MIDVHVQCARYAKQTAESGHVAARGHPASAHGTVLNVALFDHRHRCLRGQFTAGKSRVDVVDGIEILRGHQVIATAGVVGGRSLISGGGIDRMPAMGIRVIGRLANLGMVGMRRNLAESFYPCHNRSQGRGNLRILYVRSVPATANIEVVQLRVKSLAHLAGGARKVNHAGVVQHAANLEAVRLEPCCDLRNVFRRSAETRAELFGSQPLVIFRRSWLFLASEEIVQVGLLRGAALQQQIEVQWLPVLHRAKVWRCSEVLADIALQGDAGILVDGLDDARGHERFARLRD